MIKREFHLVMDILTPIKTFNHDHSHKNTFLDFLVVELKIQIN